MGKRRRDNVRAYEHWSRWAGSDPYPNRSGVYDLQCAPRVLSQGDRERCAQTAAADTARRWLWVSPVSLRRPPGRNRGSAGERRCRRPTATPRPRLTGGRCPHSFASVGAGSAVAHAGAVPDLPGRRGRSLLPPAFQQARSRCVRCAAGVPSGCAGRARSSLDSGCR